MKDQASTCHLGEAVGTPYFWGAWEVRPPTGSADLSWLGGGRPSQDMARVGVWALHWGLAAGVGERKGTTVSSELFS